VRRRRREKGRGTKSSAGKRRERLVFEENTRGWMGNKGSKNRYPSIFSFEERKTVK
jgi:hypothetical protein